MTVKAGQPLGKIAASAGVSLAALLALNPQVLKEGGTYLPTPPRGRSGTRITLQCGCRPVARTFQIGLRVAAVGGIRCEVCGE
ncbi:LysM domain-containing protein [Streptomyces sp. NBC_01525]|uniref:LysM peptidoglycan-binding domain-containing protein n=1 Tax=Streptomyces sp. NBC_01525 TaxID=2903893 RepID=UPI0038648CD1